ncbi:MAG: hypothetical protein ABI384_00960 [Allobranchiibius sp.]
MISPRVAVTVVPPPGGGRLFLSELAVGGTPPGVCAATFVTLAAALALFTGGCHSSRLGLAHVISPRIVSTGLFFVDLRLSRPVFVAHGRTSIE